MRCKIQVDIIDIHVACILFMHTLDDMNAVRSGG